MLQSLDTAIGDPFGISGRDRKASRDYLLHHDAVDNIFESLAFDAGAASQLPILDKNHHDDRQRGNRDTASRHTLLVVSPYVNLSHLLNLDSVSPACQLLALALTVLRPLGNDYATAIYKQAFNWSYVVETLRSLVLADEFDWASQSFYIVVFRSQLKPGVDRSQLGALDKLAHEEASSSGGLLKYWFGIPDENNRNLATCEFLSNPDPSTFLYSSGPDCNC